MVQVSDGFKPESDKWPSAAALFHLMVALFLVLASKEMLESA